MSTNVFETIFDFPSDIGVLLFGNVKLLKGSDNMIYVSAASGGTTAGIIFKLNMDGSGFEEVHTFLREDDKGWIPMRLLEGPDSKLYGIAAYGGMNNTGVVFSMNRDGSDYQTVFQLPEELGLRLAAEVDLNLIPKIPHQITFSLPSPTAQVGGAPMTLHATSDAGFPVAFFSSDPTIAKIEGSTLKILKAGEVTISAKQVTNDFYTQGTVAHVLSIAKGNQVLTFNTILSKTVGDAQFELTATSSAGLPVSYSTTDDNISLSGNKVTAVSAGMTTIKAEQAGDANYNAAPTVEQSFCINPPKPTVTQERISATEILLTSSNEAGNQWYFNGVEIALATAKTFMATAEGTHTVKTTVETCASELSDEFSTTITGIEVSPEDRLAIYPNPVQRHLVVEQKKATSTFVIISIIDSSGKVLLQRTSKNTQEVFDVGAFGSGLYQIQVQADGKFFGRRFVKN
jgi:hypothetical protein